MLGLLGLRIFEATGADIADLGPATTSTASPNYILAASWRLAHDPACVSGGSYPRDALHRL